MNIAAFTARHASDYRSQARKWRQEAQSDRKKADASLIYGDREGHARWLRQAAQCERFAAECDESAEQMAALKRRAEVLA